jgi:menaquinone-9 beta-reductase
VSSTATGQRVDSDVLIIGGGPAGASAALVLAQAGHRVTIVEKRTFPRTKTCGDALSPLAVAELHSLGFDDTVLGRFHRVDLVRLVAHGRTLERPWPSHHTLPSFGYVARRDRLDDLVVRRAVDCGATLLDGREAVAPIVERGFVRGATVIARGAPPMEHRARFTLVADGANSRFGRSLGTFRQRAWPYATAIRSYWSTPLHDQPVVESVLDLVGRDGTPITGYGWVFPLGDGTVNVGVGVVSTSQEFRSLNTTHLLARFAADIADRWQLSPDSPLVAPASGRIPMGGSVGPTAGPAHLVIGDAAGAANPLTGAGIEYALATGKMAGGVLDEALRERDATVLQRYPRLLSDTYGTYFKVGRLLDRLGGRATAMDRFARTVVRWPSVADTAIRRPHDRERLVALDGIERSSEQVAQLVGGGPPSASVRRTGSV